MARHPMARRHARPAALGGTLYAVFWMVVLALREPGTPVLGIVLTGLLGGVVFGLLEFLVLYRTGIRRHRHEPQPRGLTDQGS
ncbi:hypothetical protein [Actinotalea sp. C106]|uniref:hypothetical protein n=1 Tax=Actinotalea sp. C106 TaxID=2908644 RepID=UPI002027D15B|nr:hypothetical protein [Actinotalea sp. C106]